MKRSIAYGLAAAIFAACSTQELDIQTPVREEPMFYATFEQPAEEGTKVYATEDLLLRWTADDRVSIFNKNTYNQQYKFAGATGDNSGGFDKVEGSEFVTGNAISHVVSVYPYDAATRISESETISLTLPAEQHYAENTFGLGSNTMVSVSSDNFLQYKNVCGFLRITLYGQGTVSSITLKGNNGEKLAGNATVTMPVDGEPSVQMASDASDTITLICDNYVGLNPNNERGTDFWFVVPPVTFSKGFTVTVNTLSNWEIKNEKSTSKSLTIERNKLSKMSPFEVIYQPRNIIYYQSTDNEVVIPYSPNGFGGANIVSNVMLGNNHYGALIFDRDLTSIDAYAFNNCTNLSSINIPEGVTSTGYGVFNNCTELYNVFFNGNSQLTSIEAATFQGCKYLSSVFIPWTVTSIGAAAFNQCSSLRYINIPTGVTGIGEFAFSSCSSLQSVTLPAELTSVGRYAFSSCSSLTSLRIPAGVTSIGDHAFENCNQLTKITVLPDTPPAGGSNMFDSTNDCPIFVPEGSVDSYKSASGWSDYADRIQAPIRTLIRYTSSDGKIVEPTLPQNLGADVISNVYANGQGVITLDGLVTVLGSNVFSNCETLTSIQIPESVVLIESAAFMLCTSLESVSLPEELTDIGGFAFFNCSSLKTISIPDGVPAIAYNTFQGCSGLESISIPESVTKIDQYAFQGCSSLESVSIPDHVTAIGQCAFQDCSSLTSITLPHSLKTIDFGTFSNCTSLSAVFIPESVNTINAGAFQNCTALKSVTIPKDIYEMYSAFDGCTELTSVTMLPYYPPGAYGAFGIVEEGSVNEDLIIYVPKGRVDAYKAANYWCDLADHIYEVGMPMAVDLGLPSGIKWASCNLGATKPEEFGDYYAWGETEPYYSSLDPLTWRTGKESGYNAPSYKWSMGSDHTMTKYCGNSEYGYDGFTDTKTVLDPEDDAAHVNLGGIWRMPTGAEWDELADNCTITRTAQNGVSGILVTASNGNSIFLPAAGGWSLGTSRSGVGSNGQYWSSSLDTENPSQASYVFFTSYNNYARTGRDRYTGFSIRPVCAE